MKIKKILKRIPTQILYGSYKNKKREKEAWKELIILSKAEKIIYEVISDIENDFDNKLTIHDIYTKLIKIQDIEVPLDVAMDDLINCD